MKKGQKNTRKKQERALKKRSEKKQKLARRKVQEAAASSPKGMIRRARRYPIEGCWVQRGWQDGGLAVVAVARTQPDENLVFGTYLVDYYCLGLKDTVYNANIPPDVFHHEFLPRIYRGEPPLSISPDLAHEIVYGAIEYARQFEFRPHREFSLSQNILDPPDAHPRSGNVEFGKDGKPFYVPGPRDNPYAIIGTLERTAGAGNYDFIAPVMPPGYTPDEEEEFEVDEAASPLWLPTYDEDEEDENEEETRSTLWTPGAPDKVDEPEGKRPRFGLWIPGR